MAFNITVRSHVDTSGSGGLSEGLHTIDRADVPTYETQIDNNDITFFLPIVDIRGLNRELNQQIKNLYLSDEEVASSGGSGITISDDAYSSIGWNANLDGASKNALRDKFETFGTMSTQDADGVIITGGSVRVSFPGISLEAFGGNDLIVKANDAALTANRNLSIVVNDANRGIDLSGDLILTNDATIEGVNTGDVTLAGETYLSRSAQIITANSVNLSGTHVTGILAAGRFPALTGDVTTSSGSVATTIATGAVSLAKMANMATSSLIYRKTAGSGVPEVNTLATLKTDLGLTGTNSGDLTLAGENYLSIASQVVTANAVNLSGTHVTGTLAAGRFPALTGDVTTSAGSLATTIANNAVTLAKMATVATASVLGRNTAGTGNVEVLTTLPTGVMPAFTGDVTNLAGSLATTIASGAVSLGKMANLAANSIIGNNTGLSATPIALTASQVRSLLSLVVGTNVQAWDADLDTLAGLTATTDNFIVSVASAWASRTPAQVKTTLSINNVENTAISTWAGSTNITTLGTVTTGTWSGTGISIAKGGTNATSADYASNGLLRYNGTKFISGSGLSYDGSTLTQTLGDGVATQNMYLVGGGTNLAFQKDAANTISWAIGLSTPGSTAGSDFVFSSWAPFVYSERLRFTTSQITLSDNYNIATNTTTGTKIGTSTSQKIGFWNKTPIVQPTTAVTGATVAGSGGTALTTNSTFDGYTVAKVVAALRNIGLLA